jgi:hypothetical protein
LDLLQLASEFKKSGNLTLEEGNGKIISFCNPEQWTPELGKDWIYLIYELFQIRIICGTFSEVSLDVVEYASKPTIYHSIPNKLLKSNLIENGKVRFALIREPNWNKFLFQFSKPILVKLDSKEKPLFKVETPFPLYSPSVKELFLSADGDVKIIKG